MAFVTQVPTYSDFASRGSTFANHLGGIAQVARGGDLVLLSPDGRLRKLTRERPASGWTASGRRMPSDPALSDFTDDRLHLNRKSIRVRERVWVSFQPGEVRVCASCHGLNSRNQAGQPVPTHPPQALRELLGYWKSLPK